MAKKKSTSEVSVGEPNLSKEVGSRVSQIRAVKLSGIGLDRTESWVDRLELASFLGRDDELESELTLRSKVIDHLDDHFTLGVNFSFTQTSKEPEKQIVFICADFSAKFDLAFPVEAAFVKSFKDLEARLVFFPYVRHFISDMTYRMSINPVLLPLTSELER